MDVDEVEIAVKAVGVNFRDILIALGQLPEHTLGSECAGIVTRVGDAVKGQFKIGDRVVCAMKGAYRTYVAHIQKGESVLIHAGAGGFGQASIQLAKMSGAVIYVTVSTRVKKRLLMDLYDIPEDNFFSSRTLALKDGIMKQTGGRGVDVVINSLTGDALRYSWECLAPFGRFIEVGKRDILAPSVSALGGLPMSPFSKNVTFASVDLILICQMRPDLYKDFITSVIDLAKSEKITTPQPLTVYKVSKAEDAFRLMQSGKHSGKLVLEFDDNDRVRVTPPFKQLDIFDSQATYVIAGGLGGIGRSISKWMVSRNVKHLVLLSRKTVYPQQILDFLRSLKAKGVNVLTPPCNVADEDALKEVLAVCAKIMPPIRGCIQASMVLKSAMFSNMTFDDFEATVKPKVAGAWNLHKLLPSKMDFFIMLSSYAGIVGSLGQSNYAAGNTYQDGLARYRDSIGEKATSLDLGIVESVGFVAEHDEIRGFSEAGGNHKLTQVDLHKVLAYYCNPGLDQHSAMKSQVITGLPLPRTLREKNIVEPDWLSKPLFGQLHEIDARNHEVSRDPSNFANLGALVSSSASLSDANTIISNSLKTRMASLLMIEEDAVDLDKPIHSFGVDSLVAVEIRNWFKKVVDADIAVFDILGQDSISSMGAIATRKSGYTPAFLETEL
ncbi:hypothetical protein HYALB_00000431 [Hymenoscyphus albidus]|uniref:Carrier domain-containing protein n=1 Tax=Hymenoscyphus albidus TaxID=595503 RepID=A0A9N9LKX7_9HELO|nr:hypothetical protein HYALB_00000431 [Hymenoscyphus albidus]